MSLIGPDDPPAAELRNPDGRAALLLLCDHAQRRVPRALGDLGLDETAFERHIAWDIGALDVASALSAALDAPLALANYSRLVVDVNRAPDQASVIPVESDGTTVPANVGLAPEARAERIAALHAPYHGIVAQALDRLAPRAPAVVSIHSFTPVFKGVARPWQVGILWNRDGRLARPVIRSLGKRPGLAVGDNEPYSGKGGLGYTVKRHAEARRLPHITFEIRQDLIDTRSGAEEWAAILRAELEAVLAKPLPRRRARATS